MSPNYRKAGRLKDTCTMKLERTTHERLVAWGRKYGKFGDTMNDLVVKLLDRVEGIGK